jgi:hypothetical protein
VKVITGVQVSDSASEKEAAGQKIPAPAAVQKFQSEKLLTDGSENLGCCGLPGLAGATTNQLDGWIAG